ncbi:FHA domain-containing protein NDAI_0A00590 [Naumovozyma dairenensis CBS 421]|uniref:FHA domain-containing protein n=1 Tax=Naumovozyma dairenensis (strain ATCC 10597 / BCRC 20456 / CBS 421 / NBRC 0211 / NRRL Y-12639) TaxID=1071378 RepID=G0W329_NAUDC|nr:hypothetical protein NDAI_0A00590 [Naumovozyma dairenensis CBS 421]CCD22217.1 hypothetical protein NDAI_0A00590 [Naumovozyma dairenensis CBS 421]
MSNHTFPPSSPLASQRSFPIDAADASIDSNDSTFSELVNDSPITSNNLRAVTLGKVGNVLRHHHKEDYPSPLPSSSTGRYSSPTRAPTSYHSTIQRSEVLNFSSKPTRNPHKQPLLEDFPIYKPPKTKPIDLELQSNNAQTIIIGRQSTSCDVTLPKLKHISRKHASISYISSSNQVRLECLGSNGLVVLLPFKLSGHLVRRIKEMNTFEISSFYEDDELVNSQDKILLKDKELTSFVLLKGETVLIPFINGTTIDFRDSEVILHMKQLSETTTYSGISDLNEGVTISDDNDNAIVNNSNHVSANSSVFGPEQSIEASTPIRIGVTPHSSFTVQTPATPQKIQKHISIHNPKNTVDITPTDNRDPSISILKRPLEQLSLENDHQQTSDDQNGKLVSNGHKKVKLPVDTYEQTDEEILKSLEQRGVDYKSLQHVLANHLAFANIQQTPLHQLKQVNSKTNALKRKELRALLKSVKCIGVIYRHGKDAAGKPLDEEYYYDLENDDDQDRRNLVTSLKGGRTGLRSCRKTHKQYFWKKPTK